MSKEKQKHISEDSDILEGLKEGNSLAIDVLYSRFYPSISHMILQNHGREDEAKDIFQEAVIILYDKVHHGDFYLSSKLQTFLYSVCRRLWLKQLNRTDFGHTDISGYEDVLSLEDDQQEEKINIESQFEVMEDSLNQLGEPCRTILQDFYIHNMSMQDICEKFGYTNTDNAKTQKYKCLQRLKKLFFKS